MKKLLVYIIIVLLLPEVTVCQSTKHALFLGNSYTGVNNLPQIIANFAGSMHDSLVFDMNTPGGYTLQLHSVNNTSLNKIMSGKWDFVVLQEQSQLPSFPASQVQTDVFPYAHFLDSMINEYNHCCETMFYMTWGRKNGDTSNCASWPPVCTYAGMDSILYSSYMAMAINNHAVVSPVGQVWKYIRQNYPAIELYQSDESHPSAAGSYAAACCFYTAMFRKDPEQSAYNYVIAAADAGNIRAAVKYIVYDSLLKWQIGKYDAAASFSFSTLPGRKVNFHNLSGNADSVFWDFGDQTLSVSNDPVHVYSNDGDYHVVLTAHNCNSADTVSEQVVVAGADSVQQNNILFYPNPVRDYLYISLQTASLENISIFNCLGQKLYPCYNIAGNKIRVNMTAFPVGVYFVSVLNKGNRLVEKILKE